VDTGSREENASKQKARASRVNASLILFIEIAASATGLRRRLAADVMISATSGLLV
jgi:hypothetical protein